MKKYSFFILIMTAFTVNANAQDNTVHTPKGATVTIFTHNTGDKIKLNDVITFEVVQKTSKDSVLFSSYVAGHPVKIQVQASQNVGDLMEVLPLLTVKDSALVQIPADSIFQGHEQERPAFFPKGSNLLYYLKIERVQSLNDAIAERNAAMEGMKVAETAAANKYIADNKLVVTTTPSGLKYIITAPTLKRKPLSGDTVLVNYTGSLLDGKVFDSSIAANAEKAGLQQPGRTYEPIKVTIGAGGVITGWEEALLLMSEGSKAKFIIPSALAYGAQGQGDIGPYSTLLFDLELVKIIPGKHPVMKTVPKKPVAKKRMATKKKN